MSLRLKIAVVFLSCAILRSPGFAQGNSNQHPTTEEPDAAQHAKTKGTITIVAPANGSTVTSLPTTLQVTFSREKDAAKMTALLDGVDITAQFSPANSPGTRQAVVNQPAVNLGMNQLQISVHKLQVQSTFTVALGGPGGPGGSSTCPASAGLPLLVPIQSRVLTGIGNNAVDYNFALYCDPNNPTNPTLVEAPEGGLPAFQVTYLSRVDLSVVSNQTVPNLDPGYDGFFTNSPLYKALTQVPAGCGTAGCLLLVQSLQTIGYTPCTYHQNYGTGQLTRSQDCVDMTGLFKRLGGSGRVAYANPAVQGSSIGMSEQVAYSFIGNTNAGGPSSTVLPGTNFERLSCSATSGCDAANAAPSSNGSAPTDATLAQIGNISGALIRDNFNNYTYAVNAPIVTFSSQTQNSGNTYTHSFTIGNTNYVSNSVSPGGFHAVVLDRTTLALLQNQTIPTGQNGAGIGNVFNSLSYVRSAYNYLVFFAAFGNTSYSQQVNRDNWYAFSGLVPNLGGTQQVFFLMNNPQQPSPPFVDDYTLVGGPVDWDHIYPTGLENEVGAEMSSVISRETETTPLPSDMEGLLEVNHEGYYSPKQFGHNVGLTSTADGPFHAEVLSASLQNPTPWPFPGPNQTKSQAAYTWISQQLCCNDIRSAYVNLNADPSIWLEQLQQLNWSSSVPGTDEADFDAMKAQLATEFEYVSLVRLFQSNMTSLFQDQEINYSLLLQQAQNDVLANLTQIQISQNVPAASVTSTLENAFGLAAVLVGLTPGLGPAGAAIKTTLTLTTAIMKVASTHTNSPSGVGLKLLENVQVKAGDLAGTAADEFAQTLISVGNQFDRIVTDWGRLQTLGQPLLKQQLPWDSNAAGLLLRGYDTLTRRDLYTKLVGVVSQVVYYSACSNGHCYVTDQSYIGDTDDSSGEECPWESFDVDPYWHLSSQSPLLFYPSGNVNTDTWDTREQASTCSATHYYPNDYQWAIWTLVLGGGTPECAPQNPQPDPYVYGLFKPLNLGDTTALGAYRLWFFLRGGIQINIDQSQMPSYEVDECDSHDQRVPKAPGRR